MASGTVYFSHASGMETVDLPDVRAAPAQQG